MPDPIDFSGLYKFLVQRCAPRTDMESNETHVYPVGTVHRLSPEEAERSLAAGLCVPFDEGGCPECKRQHRPCSLECWQGAGQVEETYFPYLIALQQRPEKASVEEATPLAPEAQVVPPVSPSVVVEEPVPPPATEPVLPPPTPSKRKPAEPPSQ